MKQKHILKWLGIALGVYLLYGVLTAILVPLPQKEATGELWSQYEARLSEDASQERVRSIEDTDSALLWRLQLIESAEREVIFSTFDLRADGSGQDLMAALYGAAQRGVRVRVIVDGLNGFLHLQNSGVLRALAAEENVEVRFYDPIDLLRPWKLNYRLHDKYLIADGDTVSVLDGTTDIPQERVIVTGAQSGDAEVTLPAGEKVTVTHGDDIEYATTRNGERVSELLRRLQISVSPLEMVLVDVTEEEVEITVASDFTYYETATEAAPHTTLTSTSYRIPKGETQVVQQGIDGTRDIVYEVVYADGQFVSRQAVEEKNDTSVAEITYTGTLVDKAQSGDTVKSVVTESNGSGYLLMKSGDSVHFSGSMKVTCTAYTAGYGGVGTRTATGTTVHVGTVAVDKKVIPLGTEMFIVGSSGYTYGNAVAEDTGVRGAAIDLYMNSYQECKQFGRQKNSTVYFLD